MTFSSKGDTVLPPLQVEEARQQVHQAWQFDSKTKVTCQTKCAPFNPFHTDYLTNAFYMGGGRCDVTPYVVRTFVSLNTQAIQPASASIPLVQRHRTWTVTQNSLFHT